MVSKNRLIVLMAMFLFLIISSPVYASDLPGRVTINSGYLADWSDLANQFFGRTINVFGGVGWKGTYPNIVDCAPGVGGPAENCFGGWYTLYTSDFGTNPYYAAINLDDLFSTGISFTDSGTDESDFWMAYPLDTGDRLMMWYHRISPGNWTIHDAGPYITQNITSTTTWPGGPEYTISGNLEIEPGVTLTIEPGAIIKFDTATSSSLTVNGTLNSIGSGATSTQVFFTSEPSTASSSPIAGDWGGIYVNPGGTATFAHSRIIAGGAGGVGMINNNGGLLAISSSTLAYSSNYGLLNNSGTTTIEGTDIAYNDEGIRFSGGSIIADNNIIHDNTSFGLNNTLTSNIDATDNYWGTSTGPYNLSSNSTGTGNAVSDYVTFSPWLNAVHYLSGVNSVDNGEIRWGGTTKYSTEFDDAVDTWNALGSVNIAPDTIYTNEDLTVSDVDESDLPFAAQWYRPAFDNDQLYMNDYYMQNETDSEIQHSITHELGHALGLDHSYLGNIMYFEQTDQTTLGQQDMDDYYYLWP